MRFRLRRSLPYEDRKEEAPSCQIVQQNYAIDAKIKDRLVAVESAESEAAQTYANLIVVKAGNEETEKTRALVAAMTSDKIRDFLNDTYDGAVIAVF